MPKHSENPPPQPPTNDDRLLAAYLTDRDARCPICLYNLRGLTSPRCPECGHALRLTVGAVDPTSLAWITIVAVLWAAGGIGGVLIYFSIREGIPIHMFWAWWQFACFYAIMACAPLALLALFLRRPFQKLPKKTQWRIAGFVIIPVALFFIIPVLFS
jgi:hypothetical protein